MQSLTGYVFTHMMAFQQLCVCEPMVYRAHHVCDIVEARCVNWKIDLDEHLCSRINQSVATNCRMFGHVHLRNVAKVSCNQYVYVNKINSTIYTVHIPRRQLLPSPLKAHTCSHTQQSLDIHCDCTQEDSRHCPQNVSVYICSLYCKSLYST